MNRDRMLLKSDEFVTLLNAQDLLDNSVMRHNEKVGKMDKTERVRLTNYACLKELSEAMAEVESFKYWKKHKKTNWDAFLEECIDVMHFLLSNINTLKLFKNENLVSTWFYDTDTVALTLVEWDFKLTEKLTRINTYAELDMLDYDTVKDDLYSSLGSLMTMLLHLGFTHEQIIEEYYRKNKINLKRQEDNY